MSTPLRQLAPPGLVAAFCLAGCPTWVPLAGCGDDELCSASSGATGGTSTGSAPGEVQTVTGGDMSISTSSTTMTAGSPPPPPVDTTTTGEPALPAVLSVMFTPAPIEAVGSIAVEVVTEHADRVRMEGPGLEPVELSKGKDGLFHGAIEIFSGLSNGTHEARFVPGREDVEGTAEIEHYSVMLPEAGSEVLWDTIQDEGSGQIEAVAVLGETAIVGLTTVFEGNDSRCYLHRRNLDGTYAGAAQMLFPEFDCTAVDILTAEEMIYLVVELATIDGPRWRLASMAWGGQPNVLHTGAKGERARALARSASGLLVTCGVAPSSMPIMDTIDGWYWPLNRPGVALDYLVKEPDKHRFNESVTDCAFRGEQLVLVGEVVGPHEELNPPKSRARPALIEIDGQGEPHWIVPGLGPGNVTQGGATALAIDDQGRAVVALYTCGDTCVSEPELRFYEPGGAIAWQMTLPAGVSVPFDVAWSRAGYAIVAGAHGTGFDTQFLLQGYVPGTYTPAWTFAKGKQGSLNVAFAVVAAPGVVVGGGLGFGGYPAFAFVHP